jgi:precorrin-2 dehydrogenase / sirohydrochlorin ferrochelatase
MLPLMLDLARLRLVLVGNGAMALRRLHLLEEAGADLVEIYAATPSTALAKAAGSRLRRRWPGVADLAQAQLVFIADPPEAERAGLAILARAAGAILHVEDDRRLSDVHAAAVLRRGDLTIAVSTGGGSPSLAVQIRNFLAGLFGREWQEHLDELAALRRNWRDLGTEPAAISRLTEDYVTRQGWVPYAGTAAAPVPDPTHADQALK